MIGLPQPYNPTPTQPRLLELGDDDPVAKILEAMKGEDATKEKTKILCKQCDHIITDPDEITIINDKFIHTFINPSGFQFDIQCYLSAPGCIISGTPTDFFSWFNGYQWQFCYCKNCSNHIGWYYTKGDDQFYGLNLATLKGDI